MSSSEPANTRGIAPNVIRPQLDHFALEISLSGGFDKVTINDVITAASVSPSAFVRYLGTKEQAVVGALDRHGGRMTEMLCARPEHKDTRTALPNAFEEVLVEYREDPASTLERHRLTCDSPSPRTARTERRHWVQSQLRSTSPAVGTG
jgi:AcrR family transcriptional regulator